MQQHIQRRPFYFWSIWTAPCGVGQISGLNASPMLKSAKHFLALGSCSGQKFDANRARAVNVTTPQYTKN